MQIEQHSRYYLKEILSIWMNILLYYSMKQFEFANSVWCPFELGDIKEIEKSNKGPQSS